MSDSDMLARLSDFIDYESPDLAEVVYRLWGDQQRAITYRELRNAIMDGSLALQYLKDWHKDYSRFINEAYRPVVVRAIQQAADDLRTEYGVGFYDPSFQKIDDFIQSRGGKLIRDVTTQQYTAINTLVREAALTRDMTMDQLARAIRPCVGLTRRQAQTTLRYYQALIEDGYSHKQAEQKQLVYASKIHRRRAALIAQTELAYAYSAGWHDTVQQNVEDGILPPDTKKVWLTAEDEKVCDVCGAMNGETVPWYEHFSDGSMYPPAHPNCRCHHKIEFVELLQNPIPEPEVPDMEDDYLGPDEVSTIPENISEEQRLLTSDGNDGTMRVDTGGLRNEVPLTEDQQKLAADFAVSLGMPREKILFSDYTETGYNANFDVLIIGTDAFPNPNGVRANSLISYRGAMGHEVVGHMETCLAGTNYKVNSPMDEAQASYRAAVLIPSLTAEERDYLLQDAQDRLSKIGKTLDDVIHLFDVRRHKR